MYNYQVHATPSQIKVIVALAQANGWANSNDFKYLLEGELDFPCFDIKGKIVSANRKGSNGGQDRFGKVIDFNKDFDLLIDILTFKVKPFIPIHVKLNDKYTAVVHESNVEVGCSRFSFDSVKKLNKMVLHVEKENKGLTTDL